MPTDFYIRPYNYQQPTWSKIITMVCPDMYEPTTTDEIRAIIGNLYINEPLPFSEYDLSMDYGADAEPEVHMGHGIVPRYLDLEEADDEGGYRVLNINIPENSYISHAEMATTRITLIDSTKIVPNFKIPMRFFGSDPNMVGGDQFWYTYFMGGEFGNHIYKRKLDRDTVFYDEAIRTALPYTEQEVAAFGAHSDIGLGAHAWSISPAGPDDEISDPFSLLGSAVLTAAAIKVEPKMVYYNTRIGEYISWAQELQTERLMPCHTVYESLAETRGTTIWAGSYRDWYYSEYRIRQNIGDGPWRYLIQWDIPYSESDIVKASWKNPISPYDNYAYLASPTNVFAGLSVEIAQNRLAEQVADWLHTPEKHYWAKWYPGMGYWHTNTASMSDYLYHYTINSFSASTLEEVDKRNENILLPWEYWSYTYAARGKGGAGLDPDQAVYGMFPYYTRIVFPTHHSETMESDVADTDRYSVQRNWVGVDSGADPSTDTILKATWEQPTWFLKRMAENHFSAKFLETIKDMNDGVWSPLAYSSTELVREIYKIEGYGDVTTQERPGRASVATHQAVKYDLEIDTEKFRSFDYMEFLASVYNNPTEQLNSNFMFMGGDVSTNSETRLKYDATYFDDGLHRFLNSSASIGMITDSARLLVDSYANMMQRMLETDTTIDASAVDADYWTVKGFLEPNLRHSEVLAYRVEKLGGATTEDQTNTNVIQNIYSLNDYREPELETDTDGGNFFQYFDSQIKYGKDYTYNVYAYILNLGYRYRYGDFRLTRQLHYYDDEDKYCLEFYDPFTMERAGQQFKVGSGLLSDESTSFLVGLWDYFSGDSGSDFDLFGGTAQENVPQLMKNIVGYAGYAGSPSYEFGGGTGYLIPDSVEGGEEYSIGSYTYEDLYYGGTPYAHDWGDWGSATPGAGDHRTGYVNKDEVPDYSLSQWITAISEINRRSNEWLIQDAQHLAALDSSVFESEIWQELGIAGTYTSTGQYESIYDQLEKVGRYMSQSAMASATESTSDHPVSMLDFDALRTETAREGVIGSIEYGALARLSAIASEIIAYTSYPFLMDYNIYIEPCLKVYEIPMNSSAINLTDNPASPMSCSPFQHIDASKKIGFHAIYESEQDKIPYPPALSQKELTEKIKYLTSKSLRPFEALNKEDQPRSPQRFLEVFRTDKAPGTYLDFEGKLLKTIDLRIQDSIYNSLDAIVSDEIEENKKYYYLLRFKTELGTTGWPSTVYEVELVNDGGYNYAVFNEYEGITAEEDIQTQITKTFKKLLQVQPNLSHLSVFSDSVDLSMPASSQLEQLQVGTSESSIWGKKFKLRLTSKKTGKKVDLNIQFNLKEEDKSVSLYD